MLKKINQSLLILIFLCTLLSNSSAISADVFDTAKAKLDKGETITLADFPDILDQIPIPALKEILISVGIKKPKYYSDPWIKQFIGKLDIRGTEVDITLTKKRSGKKDIDDKNKKKEMSFTLHLPKGINFEKTFPELKGVGNAMKKFGISDIYFVFSNFSYLEPNLDNIMIDPGFNFIATIDFTGELVKVKNLFDTLIDRLNKKSNLMKAPPGFFTFKETPIMLKTSISTNPTQTPSFEIRIPWQFGLDFTKITQDPFVQKLSWGNFEAQLSAKAKASLRTSIFLNFKTQPDPLEFKGFLDLEASGAIALGGEMKGKYNPAFGLNWLSLGPLGFMMGVMIEPPWLDEISLKGGAHFGNVFEIDKSVVAIDISSGNLLLNIEGLNLNITQLIELLVTISGKIQKKDVQIPEIPTIEFTDLHFTFAPIAMEVFDKWYEGIAAGGDVHIDKFKGGSDVLVIKDPPFISAQGRLYPFEFKANNKTIIRITGPGEDKKLGTKDDRAQLDIQIKPDKSPLKQKFAISGLIEIPPIKFKQETNLEFKKTKLYVDTETTLFGSDMFHGKALIVLDAKNPQDFAFDISFDQKLSQYVKSHLNKALTKFQDNAQKDLDKAKENVRNLDLKIDEYQGKLNKANEDLNKWEVQELTKLQNKLKEKEEELRVLKANNPKLKFLTKPWIEAENIKTEIAGLKIAIFGLKAVAGIAEAATKAVRDLPEAIKVEESLKAIAMAGLKVAEGSVDAIKETAAALTSGVFVLESASIKTDGKDLVAGKLPLFSMKVQIVRGVTLEFKDLQFDFTNPGDMFENIARQLVESVKKNKKK